MNFNSDKSLDISNLCPDIVDTKLLKQKERQWQPDPQVLSKWTNMYNLQEDYVKRVLPKFQATMNYDNVLKQKQASEKIRMENADIMKQVQEKINNDLATKYTPNNLNNLSMQNQDCEDNEFLRNTNIEANKFNIALPSSNNVNSMNDNGFSSTSQQLDSGNLRLLKNRVQDFRNKNKQGFAFKQNNNMAGFENPSPNFNVNSLINGIPLNNVEGVEYLGSTIGDTDLNKGNNNETTDNNANNVAEIENVFNEIKKKLKFVKMKQSELQQNRIVNNANTPHNVNPTPESGSSSLKTQNIQNPQITTQQEEQKADNVIHQNQQQIISNGKNNNLSIETNISPTADNKAYNNNNNNNSTNQNNNKPNSRFTQKETPVLEDLVNSELTKKKTELNIKDEDAEPILDESSFQNLNHNIINPPSISFLNLSEKISEEDVIQNQTGSFNLETQRRGRRRSRFPDPQWDCAEIQIAKLVKYLCEDEISISFQKYCKPIFQQINTMIESYLYHDNSLEICQNMHMCPITVDI
jgi:hypothetical protein